MPVIVAPAFSWEGETGSRGETENTKHLSGVIDIKSSVVVKCVLKRQPVHHPSSLLSPIKAPLPKIPSSTAVDVGPAKGSGHF